MSGLAIITEACIDVKDRACVDVCPVQCIYEFDPKNNTLFSEEEAGSGITENSHQPTPEAIALFEDSVMYRVLSARRVSCRSDLLGRECPGRGLKDALQLRGSEQGSRPHFLRPAQPGRFCRLERYRCRPGGVRSPRHSEDRRFLRPRVDARRAKGTLKGAPCLFCFWITHVSAERLDWFLRGVAGVLRPAGWVFFVHNGRGPNASTSRSRRRGKAG
jgi:hypothetical protein